MHALVIEVQPLIAMMLEEELRQLGFTSFDTAATQAEAIAAAKHRRPDLITASVRLTEGCGIEAVRIICAQEPIPTVYTISNPEEAEESIRGSIVIAKPVARDELREAVRQTTRRMDGEKSWRAA